MTLDLPRKAQELISDMKINNTILRMGKRFD